MSSRESEGSFAVVHEQEDSVLVVGGKTRTGLHTADGFVATSDGPCRWFQNLLQGKNPGLSLGFCPQHLRKAELSSMEIN